MFKKSEEYAKIKKELEIENLINEVATFESFADDIFTFKIEKNNIIHEFNIICDDIILKELSVFLLLELKSISYFNHSIFLTDESDEWFLEDGVTWSLTDTHGLN